MPSWHGSQCEDQADGYMVACGTEAFKEITTFDLHVAERDETNLVSFIDSCTKF